MLRYSIAEFVELLAQRLDVDIAGWGIQRNTAEGFQRFPVAGVLLVQRPKVDVRGILVYVDPGVKELVQILLGFFIGCLSACTSAFSSSAFAILVRLCLVLAVTFGHGLARSAKGVGIVGGIVQIVFDLGASQIVNNIVRKSIDMNAITDIDLSNVLVNQMHVNCLHCNCDRHVHMTGHESLCVFQQRGSLVYIVKHMGFYDATKAFYAGGVNQLIASIIHICNGQIIVAERNQHSKDILSGYLFRQVQQIRSEFDLLHGGISVIRHQVDIVGISNTTGTQITSAVIDQTRFDVLETGLPIINDRIENDLFVVKIGRFKILSLLLFLVGLPTKDDLAIFDVNCSNRELLFRFNTGIVPLNDLLEQFMRRTLELLSFLHTVHQVGEIAFTVDSAHVVEVAIDSQHSAAENLHAIQFDGDDGFQLLKQVVVAMKWGDDELQRTGLSHFQRQLWRIDNELIINRLINGFSIYINVKHLQPTSHNVDGDSTVAGKSEVVFSLMKNDIAKLVCASGKGMARSIVGNFHAVH